MVDINIGGQILPNSSTSGMHIPPMQVATKQP